MDKALAAEIHKSESRGGLAWESDSCALIRKARSALSFDTMVLGIVDQRQPLPEAFLAVERVNGRRLKRWCAGEHREDPLWRQARRVGRADGKRLKSHPGPPLPASQHVLVHALAASLDGRRYWYLAAGRKRHPFIAADHRRAALHLRLTHMAFDYADEPGLGRVLLDADHQLIHADPLSENRFAERPGSLPELSGLVQSVIGQRWPKLTDRVPHDLALVLSGQSTWVRFRRDRAADGLDGRFTYLELRPLSEDDSPPVGRIEDDRIAQAIAYLSDHFADTPSLAEVAAAVHTSPFHFHRLFTKHVGVSPKHFLLRTQLQIAKWMIRRTRIPVGQIAAATGFASHGHFTATFHRLVGLSPTTYRERS